MSKKMQDEIDAEVLRFSPPTDTAIGVMTRNESREKLDLNPIDGLDEPLTPMNLITSAENDGKSEVTA